MLSEHAPLPESNAKLRKKTPELLCVSTEIGSNQKYSEKTLAIFSGI
jgi:hypothetical protein